MIKHIKMAAFALVVSGVVALGQSGNDNVSIDDLVKAVKKVHAQAEAGDTNSCYELWRVGRIIEKVDVLKESYPIEDRLKLLKFAAEKGHPDASFEVFKYLSFNKKEPFAETSKWLELAHQNGNNKGSVILALVMAIDKKEPAVALNVIKLTEERIPQDAGAKEIFLEKKLTREDFKLLRIAIREEDIVLFNEKIGTAEGELKDAVEIWRIYNR